MAKTTRLIEVRILALLQFIGGLVPFVAGILTLGWMLNVELTPGGDWGIGFWAVTFLFIAPSILIGVADRSINL